MSLDELQLDVLLGSGMVEFPQVRVEGISSPQELLVYFHQRVSSVKESSCDRVDI